jgi:hypothetical protein
MLRTASTGGGRTAYGSVPNPIDIPANVFTQLSGAVPNFPRLTGGTSSLISSQQAGQISPQTMNALKTGAAQFGVASGMPGSGLEQNELFGNIAGFSENLQNRGIQNYLSLVGALGPTMTNPNLAAEVTSRNAAYAAAPDPRLAALEQQRLYKEGLSSAAALSSPTRGPWWAPGGINTPPIGATVGRSYAGGLPGGSLDQPFGGVLTATATPPIGGWPTTATQPWGTGFAVGPRYDWSGFYPGLSDEEAAMLSGGDLGGEQGFESSEYGG